MTRTICHMCGHPRVRVSVKNTYCPHTVWTRGPGVSAVIICPAAGTKVLTGRAESSIKDDRLHRGADAPRRGK